MPGTVISILLNGSTKVPELPTGASASLPNDNESTLVLLPMPTVSAGCGTPARTCGPQWATVTPSVFGSR